MIETEKSDWTSLIVSGGFKEQMSKTLPCCHCHLHSSAMAWPVLFGGRPLGLLSSLSCFHLHWRLLVLGNLTQYGKEKCKTGDDQVVECNSLPSFPWPTIPFFITAHNLFIKSFSSPDFQMLWSITILFGLNGNRQHPALRVYDEPGLKGITSLSKKLKAHFSVSLSHTLFLTTPLSPALGYFNVIRCDAQLIQDAGLELLVRAS